MTNRNSKLGFSLIELFVALSILAVVAAIIVPQFLNVRSQAQKVVNKQIIDEINNATNLWESLGGKRATLTGAIDNPYEYYYYLLFLKTESDGTDPYRDLSSNTGGSINPNLLPSDSLGPTGSWTVGLADIPLGGMTGTIPNRPSTSSQADGIYGQKPYNDAIQGGYVQNSDANNLYIKQGSEIIELESEAAALFLYTGQLMNLSN